MHKPDPQRFEDPQPLPAAGLCTSPARMTCELPAGTLLPPSPRNLCPFTQYKQLAWGGRISVGDLFIVRLQALHGLQETAPENWLLPGGGDPPCRALCVHLCAFVFARALPLPTSLPSPRPPVLGDKVRGDAGGGHHCSSRPRGEGRGLKPQGRGAQTGRRSDTGFSVRSCVWQGPRQPCLATIAVANSPMSSQVPADLPHCPLLASPFSVQLEARPQDQMPSLLLAEQRASPEDTAKDSTGPPVPTGGARSSWSPVRRASLSSHLRQPHTGPRAK